MATIFGILVALAILAMSIGLVRSETARDLRTLTAAGATSLTRRTITAATAGALALAGAVTGLLCGYLAAIGFFRTNQLDGLSSLGSLRPSDASPWSRARRPPRTQMGSLGSREDAGGATGGGAHEF